LSSKTTYLVSLTAILWQIVAIRRRKL